MFTLPPTMRAWTHINPGAPSTVLTLAPTLPVPTLLTPTSLLIAISHASLNPGGSILMALYPAVFRKKPCIPELDFSGTVVRVGEGVPAERGLKEGVEVFGSIPVGQHVGKGVGALAEFVAVEHTSVFPKPATIGFEEAAGLGVAGATALCLVDAAGLKVGDRVLVNGASGGCGHLAVQLAKNAVGESGKVVAVCSGRNADFVKGLGADEVIDYTAHPSLPIHLSTLLIDARGSQPLFTHSRSYLHPDGPFVSVGIAPTSYAYLPMLSALGKMLGNNMRPRVLGGVGRKHVQVAAVSTLETLERLGGLVGEGRVKVVVGDVFGMGDVLKAYDLMLSKHARGKIVVKVAN
ncbi:zinc-binding oxidoreductase [Fimicolochytrium jonesii]|uniref:zinc-binding oxidoreductase n=1 Tax=Fimicolochytrium jonesii TaxID=1396493 RepID=UPI0022FF40CF|nr:zinc-binding oxidoreductase [Fimicolochytrium jonesii]KAI8821344.1 zinc-binding oxidoreductase [Fimicolochytrium jonesii]